MSSTRHNHRKENKYIRLEARQCQACWKCIDACPQQVLGKIEIGWHRHVRIHAADACNGCKKCVRVCEAGALTYIYVPHAHSAPAGPDRVPARGGPFDENGEGLPPMFAEWHRRAHGTPVESQSTHGTGK